MKILGNLIKILIVVLLIYVLIQNSDQVVDLRFFTLYYPAIHLSVLLLITLGIGAILGSLMMGFTVLQLKGEIRDLKKKNKQLNKELENLRNISIEEIPEGEFGGSEEKQS